MSAKLIFVRRSQEQINIFGGEVFAEMDGRKIATIGLTTLTFEVPAGHHIVKMYKSHEYGSMIGFADSEFTIEEGEALVFNYSPPMPTTQPGHITVSPFTSYDNIEREVETTSGIIAREKANAEESAKELGKAIGKTQTYWWLLFIVIPGLIGLIYYLVSMAEIRSLF